MSSTHAAKGNGPRSRGGHAMETVRILVGMHHPLATQSQEEKVSSQPGARIETLAQADEDLLQTALDVRADAIVVDLGASVEGLIPRNGSGAPSTGARTLVLCLHPVTEPLGGRAIAATACAFFLSTSERADVEHVVTGVHALSCRHAQSPPGQSPAAVHVPPSLLKERERQILSLLAREKTSKEIAMALDLSPRTVDAHRSRLMKKLGVQSTVGLAAYAIRAGLVGA